VTFICQSTYLSFSDHLPGEHVSQSPLLFFPLLVLEISGKSLFYWPHALLSPSQLCHITEENSQSSDSISSQWPSIILSLSTTGLLIEKALLPLWQLSGTMGLTTDAVVYSSVIFDNCCY